MAFHDKLKELRNEKGWKQDLMAHKLGITQSAYSQIEDGSVKVKLEQVLKIVEILETPLDELLEEEFKIYNIQCNNVLNRNKIETINNTYQVDKDILNELIHTKNELVKAKDEIIAVQRQTVQDAQSLATQLTALIASLKK